MILMLLLPTFLIIVLTWAFVLEQREIVGICAATGLLYTVASWFGV